MKTLELEAKVSKFGGPADKGMKWDEGSLDLQTPAPVGAAADRSGNRQRLQPRTAAQPAGLLLRLPLLSRGR
jgi:hypothetical protein